MEHGVESISRVVYKGMCIAIFKHRFEPNAKGIKEGKKVIEYPADRTPIGYIETHGYLAEFSRQVIAMPTPPCTLSWTDDMKVDIYDLS
jgi:hypothetical protein